MDNLKSIWNQVSCDSNKLELSMTEKKDAVFAQLENEAQFRKRYNPLLALLIVLFTCWFGYVVFTENEFSLFKVLGVALVILAGIVIAIFSQAVKIPFHQFEHNKSSTEFLEVMKVKLNQSRKMLVMGIVLQILLLSLGLYLIIFDNPKDLQHESIYNFVGVMFALAGIGIGGSIAFFNTHYKSTYETINHFLEA